MIAIALFLAAVSWTSHETGKPIPAGAIRVDESLYVCRAKLPDGVHPGVSDGGPCLVPQKGVAQAFDAYEVAVGASYSWRAADWESAIVAGKQGRNGDLYVCRVRVTAASGKSIFAGGKAYRTGNHAGHCYVAHEGKEVDFAGEFELLVSR